jgi:hypothetical protein
LVYLIIDKSSVSKNLAEYFLDLYFANIIAMFVHNLVISGYFIKNWAVCTPSLELPRRAGRSNLHSIRDGIRVLGTVLRGHRSGLSGRLV